MRARFEWDETKNRANKRKHGIDFETAKFVFDDPFQLSQQDRIENGEERWQTIGRIGEVYVAVVAHTLRYENDVEVIRIISARRAASYERRRYENQTY